MLTFVIEIIEFPKVSSIACTYLHLKYVDFIVLLGATKWLTQSEVALQKMDDV